MDTRVKELIKQGDYLFGKRDNLLSVWQDIADNFYPEREPFLGHFTFGDEFAEHLMSSYPCIVRRDLGNLISSMLRPSSQKWFEITTQDDDLYEDHEAKQWLEYAANVQRKAMYDPASLMVEATKQADHDYITFGQTVITCELNRYRNGLLHRTWHLKDVAWMEGEDGRAETVHHKWKLPLKTLYGLFPGKLHASCEKKFKKDPYHELKGCRIVIPSENYGGDKEFKRYPFVSVWIDLENNHLIDETGINTNPYVIPVWHKVNGTQYGHSPATIVALPEARIHQAMTLTLLDAGEMATNPPLVAKEEIFRDDYNRFPGGITYANLGDTQKIQDVMTFLQQDKSGIPYGEALREDQKNTIADAMYINKINLPPPEREMTAFESSLRNQEFIRNVLPIFEPIEQNYTAQLCEKDFELITSVNGFGPLEDIPDSLRGSDVKFKFQSPLTEAIDREQVTAFMEALDIIERGAQFAEGAADNMDIMTAIRDSLKAVKSPTKWINPEEVVEDILAQKQVVLAKQMQLQHDQEEAVTAQQQAIAAKEVASAEA